MYDVATEMELQGFRVKFLSAKDIQEYYRKHHQDYKKVDIYEMTLFFVEMHNGSSFFFDEVPFICKSKIRIITRNIALLTKKTVEKLIFFFAFTAKLSS